MDQFDKNPKAILDNIKQLLTIGAKDRNHAFHTPVFSNNSDNKSVNSRVVVLRKFNEEKLTLNFNTDYRSPKIIDLTGQYIFPGFVDAHGNLKGIGYRELTLNLQGINSLNETLETVKKYVLTKESGEWIVGRGWIDKIWPEKRFPTKQDLDIFSPSRGTIP